MDKEATAASTISVFGQLILQKPERFFAKTDPTPKSPNQTELPAFLAFNGNRWKRRTLILESIGSTYAELRGRAATLAWSALLAPLCPVSRALRSRVCCSTYAKRRIVLVTKWRKLLAYIHDADDPSTGVFCGSHQTLQSVHGRILNRTWLGTLFWGGVGRRRATAWENSPQTPYWYHGAGSGPKVPQQFGLTLE